MVMVVFEAKINNSRIHNLAINRLNLTILGGGTVYDNNNNNNNSLARQHVRKAGDDRIRFTYDL